ncbi:MAG TPA: Gmad2 immunoglobulin-like domain-containing protein, partial [Ardenticatenaceae bacterium]|nr:Gmad2 immunoglobulin-like domain-containing protein [Ardenticatenaceae bacterium]
MRFLDHRRGAYDGRGSGRSRVLALLGLAVLLTVTGCGRRSTPAPSAPATLPAQPPQSFTVEPTVVSKESSPALVTPPPSATLASPPTPSPVATAVAIPSATMESSVPPAASPAATSTPFAEQPPVPTPTPAEQSIVLEAPLPGATVTSPVQVRGHVAITPFEANLVGWVFDGAGNRVGEAPITVAGELGAAGTFVGEIPFASPAGGPGRVELVEISPMDGSVVARAAVDVT